MPSRPTHAVRQPLSRYAIAFNMVGGTTILGTGHIRGSTRDSPRPFHSSTFCALVSSADTFAAERFLPRKPSHPGCSGTTVGGATVAFGVDLVAFGVGVGVGSIDGVAGSDGAAEASLNADTWPSLDFDVPQPAVAASNARHRMVTTTYERRTNPPPWTAHDTTRRPHPVPGAECW